MLAMTLPAADTINTQNDKFTTGVENKATGDSKLNWMACLKLDIAKTAPSVACGFVFNNDLFISPPVFALFSRYNICKKRRSSWRHLFDERKNLKETYCFT